MLKTKRKLIPAKYPREFRNIIGYVQMRDKNRCCGCKKDLRDGSGHTHHIDENIDNNKINNLVTVCKKCHADAHSIGLVDLVFDKDWKIPV
jgi:5-methylcytosine-specific restriction endonuclease McrA